MWPEHVPGGGVGRPSRVRPAYGARPLRRLVQQAIGDKLARALLGGEIRDGDTVTVTLAEDGESLSLS